MAAVLDGSTGSPSPARPGSPSSRRTPVVLIASSNPQSPTPTARSSSVRCPPATTTSSYLGGRASDGASLSALHRHRGCRGRAQPAISNSYPPTLAAASSFANLNGPGDLGKQCNSRCAHFDRRHFDALLRRSIRSSYTIPQQPAATPFYGVSQVVTTVTGPVGTPPVACPSGTDCINYSLPVPSGGAYIRSVVCQRNHPRPERAARQLHRRRHHHQRMRAHVDLDTNPPLALTGTGTLHQRGHHSEPRLHQLAR